MALEIIVQAPTGPAVSDIGKLDKALEKLGRDVDSAGRSFDRLGNSLSPAGGAFKNLPRDLDNTNNSLNKVKKSTDVAGQSLTNLGRIAQDAPFGFIGIQNNINPLLESFQRLKAETGSTGAAFKALGSGLLGAGGLGFAVSIVTSLLTVFTMNASKTKEAVDQLKDSSKEFKKSLNDVEAQGIATGIKLQSFVDIARDGNAPLEQRNNALKEANKILGDHGEKLTLVNIATAAVTEQIKKFTEATIQQSLASKFADRAADLIILQREAFQKTSIAADKYNIALKKANESAGSTPEYIEQAAFESQQFAKKLNVSKDALKEITRQLDAVKLGLSNAQIEANKLFGDIGFDENKNKKAKAAIETISDVLAKLGRDLNLLSTRELLFKTDETQNKINEINQAIEKLVSKFKVAPKDTIIQKLFGDIDELSKKLLAQLGAEIARKERLKIPLNFDENDTRKTLSEALSKVAESLKSTLFPGIKLNIPISPVFTTGFGDDQAADMISKLKKMGITKGLQDGINTAVEGLRFPQLKALYDSAVKQIESLTESINASLETITEAAFGGIGEAIAAAITGDLGGLDNIFAGLGKLLGSQIKELGYYLIRIGVQIEAIKKAFSSFGAVGKIAAGIAFVALGTLLEGAFNKKVQGFATGVSNLSQGGVFDVGERGRERIVLPKGSSVIPNGAVNAMDGKSNGFIAETILRGQDIVVAVRRADRSLSRNGQQGL